MIKYGAMNPDAICPASICAVIVSYQPDAGFPARLAAIAGQVDAVIVVDNASTNSVLTGLTEKITGGAICLIINPDNLGIARALNIGIAHAISMNYDWVLLFDQDSSVNAHMIASMVDVYNAIPDKEHLAVIGAHFHDVNRPASESVPATGQTANLPTCSALLWQEVDWVITSGSLLSVAAHQKIGPFRDDFFIDFVDTEYCLRARKLGYRIVKTTAPLMTHAIGKHSQHPVFGMRKWTSNHTPDRRYYITRNYTVLLRESGDYHFGWWAIKGLTASAKSIKRILFYEQAKITKLIAVFHGWWDGINGTMGKRSRHSVKKQGKVSGEMID